MKNYLKLLQVSFLFCTLCFIHLEVNASHFIGGQLSYDHLGGNDYRIVLQVWGDCCPSCAPAPESINLTIKNSSTAQTFDAFGLPSNSSISVPLLVSQEVAVEDNNLCSNELPDLCLQLSIYRLDVTLPNEPDVYQVSSQDCCRNASIVNLFNPSSQGVTFKTDIPHNTLTDNNTSAVFLYYPPVFICNYEYLEYDHSAYDVDGDSLVYGFYTPLSDSGGGNEIPVQWAGGFSETNQIDGNPPLTIDPVTGELNVYPYDIGQYVVGIKVTEYRDGEPIAVTYRDFQFNVVEGTPQVTAIENIEDSTSDLLSVYPNPIENELNLFLDERTDTESLTVRIHSMSGQEMYHANLGASQTTIGSENWPTGIYMVALYKGNELIELEKVVKM